ncbi:MAG: TonB-dependent receptor [Chitinophagales bacterium]
MLSVPKALTAAVTAGYVLMSTALWSQSLDTTQQLRAIEVTRKQSGRDEHSAQNMEIIGANALLKDACCNLSESFTNSGSVDVAYADAVSGAKEIRLLGLDGAYAQMMMENMPYLRGLANTFGMLYVPGPWMSSISVNKGAGSVVNGFESLTGQINIEFKKPHAAEKLYANLYVNQDARTELNLYSGLPLKNAKWATALLLHGNINAIRMDFNKDGFIDNPLTKTIHAMNRWTYNSGRIFNLITAVNFLAEERRGGQTAFDFSRSKNDQLAWGTALNTLRFDWFAKTGFHLSEESSLGIQYKYYFHRQQGFIGQRNYRAAEHFGYLNAIYQHSLWNDKGNIKLGASLQLNRTREGLDTFEYQRAEWIPGAFAEATYTPNKKWQVVAGIRADYHNLFGPFFTPRLHIKYQPLYALTLRASAGYGYHLPAVFAENYGLLASNRQLQLAAPIVPERAWNYGLNISYTFQLGFREGHIHLDVYRTDFRNQLLADMEQTRMLKLYNASTSSYSNSIQVEADYDLLKNWNLKVAYKFDDIRATYDGIKKLVPFRPQHKGLLAMEYTTPKKHWRFNTSLTWYGPARIPSTQQNTIENQRPQWSKHYVLWNLQITYVLKNWEFYLGGENLANQTQTNAIISAAHPADQQFDASMVWGPLRGAMAFAGFRVKIPH